MGTYDAFSAESVLTDLERTRHHDSFYLECEPIPFPPLFPVPGENPDHDIERLGVIWPSYSLPDYVGPLFPTYCRFSSIMQEVAVVYFARVETPLLSRVSVAFAESKYQKLLNWSDSLMSQMVDWGRPTASMLLLQ